MRNNTAFKAQFEDGKPKKGSAIYHDKEGKDWAVTVTEEGSDLVCRYLDEQSKEVVLTWNDGAGMMMRELDTSEQAELEALKAKLDAFSIEDMNAKTDLKRPQFFQTSPGEQR